MSTADQPITDELAAIIRDAGQVESIANSHMYQNAVGQMDGTDNTLGNMTYALYGWTTTPQKSSRSWKGSWIGTGGGPERACSSLPHTFGAEITVSTTPGIS